MAVRPSAADWKPRIVPSAPPQPDDHAKDDSFLTRIRDIIEDLTTLEVNTIVKRNILGTKMGDARDALLELARDYDRKLRLEEDSRGVEVQGGGKATFAALRERAAALMDGLTRGGPGPPVSDDTLALCNELARIHDQSRAIAEIFERMEAKLGAHQRSDPHFTNEPASSGGPFPPPKPWPSLPLTADDFMTIRKAWELGLEHIVMQTTIQLDGDVVTRIDPDFAARNTASLLTTHDRMVNVSLSFWKELFAVVVGFAEALLNLRRRP